MAIIIKNEPIVVKKKKIEMKHVSFFDENQNYLLK